MSPDRYAVAALFAPATLGAAISRSEWPAHVTLVSNFAVEADSEDVALAVSRALTKTTALEARLAGPAMFGPRCDIPVQLVESGPFPELHERLASAVEPLPQFAADEPQYWHDGYRPHITRRPGEHLQEGDTWTVRCIAAVALTEQYGTIVGVLDPART